MITIEAIEKIEDFLKLHADWNKLLSEQTENHIFLTHEWFKCWWDNFSGDARLFIVLAKENRKLVGIAPLMQKKTTFRGFPVTLLTFIENGNSLHNNFIINIEHRKEILYQIILYLLNCRIPWDILELKNIKDNSQNVISLREILTTLNCVFSEKQGLISPYITIGSDWDSYYRARSRSTKKNVNNVTNNVKKQGEYLIHVITDYKEFEQVKHELYEIAQNSWTEEIGDSISNPCNRFFFQQLSEIAAGRGWLKLWLLRLNGEAIAFEYHLQYNGIVHGLRSSYKKTYRDISPGFFLDYNIVKKYFERSDIHEYDLGGDPDFYKKRWTRETRQHSCIYIFKQNIYSKLLQAVEHKLIPFIKKCFRVKFRE